VQFNATGVSELLLILLQCAKICLIDANLPCFLCLGEMKRQGKILSK